MIRAETRILSLLVVFCLLLPIPSATAEVIGNGELYHLSLRTTDLRRPWESYRGEFVATKDWTTVEIPFAQLVPNNTDIPFNPARLRRMGILAVGRAFAADVAVGPVQLIP